MVLDCYAAADLQADGLWKVGEGCVLFLYISIKLMKKHTLNPVITLLYQFHAQKALLKVPKSAI